VTLGSPRTVGEDFAALEAVLLRIGINDHRRRAFAFGGQRFEAAIAVRIRVANKNNLALHVDAVFAQKFVVFGIAAMRIHDRRVDFARSRQPRVGRLHARIFRIGINVVSVFAKARFVFNRRGHLDGHFAGKSVEHIVASKRDVFPTLLLPQVSDVTSEFVVAFGSGGMRFSGQEAMMLSSFVGRRNRFEL